MYLNTSSRVKTFLSFPFRNVQLQSQHLFWTREQLIESKALKTAGDDDDDDDDDDEDDDDDDDDSLDIALRSEELSKVADIFLMMSGCGQPSVPQQSSY